MLAERSSTSRDTSNPCRREVSSASHSSAAARPRSSSISGRRSAEMRRVAATVLSSTERMAVSVLRTRSSSAGVFASSQARSILSEVRFWPSSSWSSREMRLFSCSRAVREATESSRRSSRACASSRWVRSRIETSRRITVKIRPCPRLDCEIEASMGNSSPPFLIAETMRCDIIGRLEIPVWPKPSTCVGWRVWKRSGMSIVSGWPSTSRAS